MTTAPEDDCTLARAGWKKDGTSWKRGPYAAMRDGYGWMIYEYTNCIWNDTRLPVWALLGPFSLLTVDRCPKNQSEHKES